jgi:ABC-type antimicrobial peptide transport system permease subunit
VTRRTKEIGIRIALGAESRQVLWLVLRDSLLLVGFGTAIGLLAAMAATRLLTGLLFGVSANDPVALTGAVAVLIAVAALAALIPARRAAQVNPTIALRYE